MEDVIDLKGSTMMILKMGIMKLMIKTVILNTSKTCCLFY
jgi:hypothetical protein